ncbi:MULTISPECIES: TerD family protein [Cobetia]|uniref:TerD family protein n=1 Tax=Cobetia TaxID=204286 RepID=UPI000469BBE0|nr:MULTISPECIES: TerD family protein [Cobetia]
MGTLLVAGQNTRLSGTRYTLDLQVPEAEHVTLDASALLLGSTGRVQGDVDFVFYNQPKHPSGAVNQVSGGRFDVDLSRLPDHVERVAFVFTVEQGLSALTSGYGFTLGGEGQEINFSGSGTGRAEKSLILMDLYRRNGEWKAKAVDQGFVGGMAPLAEHFGVAVGGKPASTTQSAPTPTPPTAVPASKPAPAPTPETKPINLSKITLEKKGQTISLEKKSNSFGKIHVNLNWEQGTGKSKSGGFLSGLMGGGGDGKIDLDLGCMYELRDGKAGVIQALGKQFGSMEQAPYIFLDGDDRSGAASNGENLYLNGHHWTDIKRVMIFAFIYEGAANWGQANGRILFKTPDQPEVEVRLDATDSGKKFCVVAMLENDNGALKVSKEVNYFAGHKQADTHYGFGFSWGRGSK